MDNKKRLVIIDANSVIYRAFHALPPLTTKKGDPINAAYGFLLVFLKAIKEFKPDFVVACFDLPQPTFRHKKFKEYKAKRPKAPENLIVQIPKIKEILNVLNVPVFEKAGFEADDIIGTISEKLFQSKFGEDTESTVLSGDLDILQLVDNNTRVQLLRQGVKNTILYNEELVRERYSGLNPDQLVDFRALRGDPSDNIPGIDGIGEKTAIDLLIRFSTLENLYKQLEKDKDQLNIRPKIKQNLKKQKEQAFLSKELAKIREDVPINVEFENCKWGTYNKERVKDTFQNLGFKTLIKRLFEIEYENEKVSREIKLW